MKATTKFDSELLFAKRELEREGIKPNKVSNKEMVEKLKKMGQ